MIENEQRALAKLGLDVLEMEHVQLGTDRTHTAVVEYKVRIREDQFGPMIRLIDMVDAVCKSNNPGVEEQFNQLLTMLALTKDE